MSPFLEHGWLLFSAPYAHKSSLFVSFWATFYFISHSPCLLVKKSSWSGGVHLIQVALSLAMFIYWQFCAIVGKKPNKREEEKRKVLTCIQMKKMMMLLLQPITTGRFNVAKQSAHSHTSINACNNPSTRAIIHPQPCKSCICAPFDPLEETRLSSLRSVGATLDNEE